MCFYISRSARVVLRSYTTDPERSEATLDQFKIIAYFVNSPRPSVRRFCLSHPLMQALPNRLMSSRGPMPKRMVEEGCRNTRLEAIAILRRQGTPTEGLNDAVRECCATFKIKSEG